MDKYFGFCKYKSQEDEKGERLTITCTFEFKARDYREALSQFEELSLPYKKFTSEIIEERLLRIVGEIDLQNLRNKFNEKKNKTSKVPKALKSPFF